MLNQGTILGTVVEVTDDRDAILVVVKTGGGTKRNGGGEWEEVVACRFWGDAKKYTDAVGPGALVKVDGSVKSRKGERGWFTAFEARYLTTVSVGASAPARAQRTDASKPAGPPPDDDSTPF